MRVTMAWNYSWSCFRWRAFRLRQASLKRLTLAGMVLLVACCFIRSIMVDNRCKPPSDVDVDSVDWSRTTVNISTQAKALRDFAMKYRHLYEENTDEFFNRLRRLHEQRRKPNNRNVLEFREYLRAALGKTGHVKEFLLTKTNVPLNDKMCFYMFGNVGTIPTVLLENLPKDTVYSPGQFKSCSVVGSSGTMRGSGCGREIDQSQSVFRFNLAPVEGFEKDVGNKTNFTTLNPSFVSKKLNSLKTQDDRLRFGAILEQFKGSQLWLPAFAVSANVPIISRVTQFALDSKIVQPVLGHPEHFVIVSTLWRKMAKTHTWPSTGLYLILSLIDICDQINVFGVWPYDTTIDGRQAPYHYHDDVTAYTSVHSFQAEFKTLVYLYERGIINIQLRPCA